MDDEVERQGFAERVHEIIDTIQSALGIDFSVIEVTAASAHIFLSACKQSELTPKEFKARLDILLDEYTKYFKAKANEMD
jgi:hypothetical protein